MASAMNAKSDKITDAFADQLQSFGDSLKSTSDDVDMLSGIQESIGELLASSSDSEVEIRRILTDRLKKGLLRRETFQLVSSTLDHYLSERIPTSPTTGPDQVVTESLQSAGDEDSFTVTTVIPKDLVTGASKELQVQVGSLLRDRFLLQEEIAGGSMGVVYKAMDRRLAEAGSPDHWVAIKVLSPQLAENGLALRALQQEAAKGRCLSHRNIVRFIDLDREDELYFLVMEWLEGRTLADILDSEDSAEIDQAAAFKIVQQIGEALEYAHRCGIVHADIKPGNIMILPNGDAKLFDFGVARVRQQQKSSEFDPGVLGAVTPAYSSMQVLTGEEPIASDDVFSLSCLLYRLLAGYRVFGPRDAAEASQEGMSPQKLDCLNDTQWRSLKKGLANSRVMRFSSIQEFLDALNENTSPPLQLGEIDRFADQVDTQNSSTRRPMLLTIVVLLLGLAYQQGLLQPALNSIFTSDIQESTPQVDAPLNEATPSLAEHELQSAVGENLSGNSRQPNFSDSAVEELVVVEDDFVGPDRVLVDFSKLPAATREITFNAKVTSSDATNFAMREDSGEVRIDFVRTSDLAVPLKLRLEEVGFSGNRSPWASGQLKISNDGIIVLPAGQKRGRVTLTMASDQRREADQSSTLRLRDAEFVRSSLAIINITLEDDDQREFESGLPNNTVSFSTSQLSVNEADPVAQIEVVRFNPDEHALNVEFALINLTAKAGDDYFAPGRQTVVFGPWQRSARILIPLVRDSLIEGDESFLIELIGVRDSAPVGVAPEVIITILDDERQ